MRLVHKSINVRPEVWRRLRLHAELSGTTVRSFLTYLIEQSNAISPDDIERTGELRQVESQDRLAASTDLSES